MSFENMTQRLVTGLMCSDTYVIGGVNEGEDSSVASA